MRRTAADTAASRPPAPVLVGPARLFLWLAGRTPWSLAGSVLFGVIWVGCQAVWPVLLGRAVDAGATGFGPHLVGPLLALLALVVSQSTAGSFNYRLSFVTYLRTSVVLSRVIGRQVTRVGRGIEQGTSSGEVVVEATMDSMRIARVFDLLPRLVGAALAWVGVTLALFASSTALGLVGLVSVPAACAVLAFLVKPLSSKQGDQRGLLGGLTALGSDAAGGLRVLRGIGGEREFASRYRDRSQEVRHAGVRVAKIAAWLGSAQIVLPGLVVALVVTTGASLVLGGRWSAGQLVTAYGFSAFLVLPISTGVEAIATITAASVSARRVLQFLRVEPLVDDPAAPLSPPPGSSITDTASGLVIRPGLLTAVVSADAEGAARLVRRLGRYDDAALAATPVLWGETPLQDMSVAESRARLLVAEPITHLFSGPLIDGLDPHGAEERDGETRRRRVSAAIDAAAAEDVVAARPDGLQDVVNERGRSFSGGERQRLGLARALLQDPEVLVLIEPTSAVDARTEQLIAERLADYRRGKTTVVVSASPLVVGQADEIAVLEAGRVLVQGSPERLHSSSGSDAEKFRSIVYRGETEETDAAPHR